MILKRGVPALGPLRCRVVTREAVEGGTTRLSEDSIESPFSRWERAEAALGVIAPFCWLPRERLTQGVSGAALASI